MSQEIRILIVDDEAAIRNTIKINLQSLGYKISEAQDGKTAQTLAIDFHPHLIILDLGLPDMHGYEVLKEFRKWTTVPIIILTVNDDEQMKVRLLDAGADDYLTKPFSTPELLARVRVGLRHNDFKEATPVFKSEDLEVDLNQKKVTIDGQLIKLSNTEFELLSRLVRENGKVMSQAQLLKQIWGHQGEDQSHYLRIYVNQLRKKIEKDPSKPRHIITEPGVGYRII